MVMAMVTMSSSAESYVGLAACEIIIPIMMMLLLLLLLMMMMLMMMMMMMMTMMMAMTMKLSSPAMLAACVCEMTCHNQRIADRVARIKGRIIIVHSLHDDDDAHLSCSK